MTILEALKRLRDDLKLWVTNNLNTKVDKSDSALTTESKTVIGAINELNEGINSISSLEVSETQPVADNVDIWVNPTADGTINIPEINDATISIEDTWSSKKISDELANAGSVKSVNGVEPDENGNITIAVSGDDVDVDLSDYYTKDETDAAASQIVSALSGAITSQAATTLANAKAYTDEKIDAIVGEGAAETLDTIGEIAAAIEEHQDVVDALNAAIGNKADASVLNNYYTSSQIDSMTFITLDEIDAICGTTYQDASIGEVTF